MPTADTYSTKRNPKQTKLVLEKAFCLEVTIQTLRALKITEAVAAVVRKDIRPYSAAENDSYVLPIHKHFIHPKPVCTSVTQLTTSLQSADKESITCDSRTSMTTDS